VSGVVASLDRCKGYKIYNLGESRRVPMTELLSLLEKHVGKKAVLRHAPDQPGDVPITYADVSRARAELDYAPHTDIDEGLLRFVAWFKEEEARRS